MPPGITGLTARDAHHPAVQEVSPHSAAALQNIDAPCFVGKTGLALGGFLAGKPPRVWEAVDAVLNVGALEHQGYVLTK